VRLPLRLIRAGQQDHGLRRAAPRPGRNGDSEHTDRPVRKGSDPPTAAQPRPTSLASPQTSLAASWTSQPATLYYGLQDSKPAAHILFLLTLVVSR
jgi:hypothetical protein